MPQPPTTVESLMAAPVVTLRREQSLPLAQHFMEHEGIRHLPVVDTDGHLVGVVSQRDLSAARLAAGSGIDEEGRTDLQLSVPVADLMTPAPWAVTPGTAASYAAREMGMRHIGCAPIVDENRALLGVVTVTDYLDALIERLAGHPPIAVADIMTRDPVTAPHDETLSSTAERMSLAGIRHLPVVDPHHNLIGVLSQRDLLRARRSTLSPATAFDPAAEVGDIVSEMTWSISPSSSVRTAALLLRDHTFGCLPVTSSGRVVGIVTDTDLLALAARLFAGDELPGGPSVPRVDDYMNEPVVCIGADESVGRARELLEGCEVSSLAVVADSGALVGLVTRTDLTDFAAEREVLAVAEIMTRRVHTIAPDQPVVAAAAAMAACGVHGLIVVEKGEPVGAIAVGDLFAVARDLRLDVRLREVMSPMLLNIDAREPIAVARRFLSQAGVTGVIVRDGRWPIGVFSRREALRVPDATDYDPVETVMSRAFLCLPDDLPLGRAAGQAAAMQARWIVALRRGRIVGVITGTDVAGALGASIPAPSVEETEPTMRMLALPCPSP